MTFDADKATEAFGISLSDEPTDEEIRNVMIDQLRRHQSTRAELEELEERGKAYLRKVAADIDAGLAAQRKALEDSSRSLSNLLKQIGESKYRVPGLGTVFFQRRRKTEIIDKDALLEAFEERDDLDLEPAYDRKLNTTTLKRMAEGRLQENGELLPGIESEVVETVVVRK